MTQLEFISMEEKKDFELIIQDALLYCQTTASVGRCVLKEIKARGRSTMGAKAFVHILLSTSEALCDYAYRIAGGQGIKTRFPQNNARILLQGIEGEQEAIGNGEDVA